MVNGKIWYDAAGNEIWSNGGHMIREADTFWWIGYETAPKRPWRQTLYSSTNLTDWAFRGAPLARAGGLEAVGWAGRPGLLHNRKTGKHVIVFEAGSRSWFRHKVGYASCDTVDGTYTLSGLEYPEPDRSSGDQSVYQEGDEAFLVTVVDSPGLRDPINRALAIYRLTPDFLHVDKRIFEGFDCTKGASPGLEAPHIIKTGDTYYWFASGLVGWRSSPTRYATAKSLAGPWSDMKPVITEPASPDSFNTQHDFVIPVTGSETTTYVYVGDRYSQWHGEGTGRNSFLPLEFRDGIPTLRWYDDWQIDVRTGRFRSNRP